MSGISDDEMIEVLRKAGTGPRSVSMSKDGIWLKANGEQYPISMDQADILFTTMFGHATKAATP